MAATDTPLVSECGGNNPCLIVPGDRQGNHPPGTADRSKGLNTAARLPDPGPSSPLPISLPAESFVFYSIFRWQERKNLLGLIAAGFPPISTVLSTALLQRRARTAADSGIPDTLGRIHSEIDLLRDTWLQLHQRLGRRVTRLGGGESPAPLPDSLYGETTAGVALGMAT